MLSALAPLFTLLLSGSQLVSAAEMDVAVGKDGKVFTPNTMTAAMGDTVKFTFYPEAHTVTQSSLDDPCTQLMDAETGMMGFDSGSMPVAKDATEMPTMTLEVNSTDPIWIYCKPHCELGMVMAINAADSGDKSFDAFQATAMGGASASAGAESGAASSGAASAASGGEGISSGGTPADAGAASAGAEASAAGAGAASAGAEASVAAGGGAASAGGAESVAASGAAGESAAASGGLEASGAAGSGAASAGAASAGAEESDSAAELGSGSAAESGGLAASAGSDSGASAGSDDAAAQTGSGAFTITPVKTVYALGGVLGFIAAFV